MFELSGMKNMPGPLEGMSLLRIGLGEGIDSSAHLPGRDGTQSSKGLPPQNTEPALHLVQPGSMSGGVMEMDIGMPGQTPVVLRFMGIQVIENDMQLCVGIESDDTVHKVQELPATAVRVMAGWHQSGGHFQGSKQRGSSMSLILVTETSYGLSIGQTQPPLSALQGLNGWLLVDADDDVAFSGGFRYSPTMSVAF